MKILFSFLLIISLSNKAQGGEILENYYNTRALGMGNVFAPFVDDHNALWFNPAAIDKIRGMHLTVLDLQVGTDALDIMNLVNSLSGASIPTIINQLTGRQVMANLSDSLAFSMRHFAFAAYDNLNININVRNPSYINTNMNIVNDFGLISGFGFSLVPNILRFGVVGKRIVRYGGSIPITPATLVTLNNLNANSLLGAISTGWGIDTGLMIELPTPIKPTFAFVWQDIGQTKFTATSSPSNVIEIPPIENNITYAFGVTADIALTRLRGAVEFKHYSLFSEQIGKKLHGGLEVEFPGFAVRGGTNQGYLTYGASLNLGYLNIDFASYGVEVGEYPGQTEDRRYFVTLTIDLSMDVNLGGDSAENGARSRRPLKFQRR
ncbi:MAG: hypothetical protein IPM57_09205 [Oligoflexia bacterium]|nr:hypothetical protein [Oligoflexia bacterium]